MTPDPICASCRGAFVEMLENPLDDPRQYQQHAADDFNDVQFPGHMDNFLRGLRNVLDTQRDPYRSASPPLAPSRTPDRSTGGRGFRFEMHSRPGGGGTRHIVVGGSNTLGRSSDQGEANVPTMSEFLRRENDNDIRGALMAQYLLALMGHSPAGRGGDAFSDTFGAQGGRWGDYVFSQEALDQIMVQIMENSTAGRPVPATDQIIEELPRDVLEEGSPLLDKDCAVCKEQFTLHPDDGQELIVVTLPCKHPFHEDCIVPWLKSSGTCPVCRHQLIAQPQPQPPGGGPGQSSHGSPPNRPSPRSQSPGSPRRGSGGTSFFQSLFHNAGGSSSGGGGSSGGNSYSSAHNSRNHFPGHWTDGID